MRNNGEGGGREGGREGRKEGLKSVKSMQRIFNGPKRIVLS